MKAGAAADGGIGMAEPAPKSVATFRPKTPEMILVALLTLGGAAFATFVAYVWRWVECSSESYSQCTTDGSVQLFVASFGVVTALGTLVASFRRRGRPWVWFLATVCVYSTWGILVLVWLS